LLINPCTGKLGTFNELATDFKEKDFIQTELVETNGQRVNKTTAAEVLGT